ncbi:MAG: Glycosyl hydrolase family [Candidatus Collierbacteria bacterium GW2011_GWF2_44_15]|uniref:Glycosyl hydrolase family n=2 Tax=Candidatus Collieribacteriota TaxID=1752725 RepID=A0A0G1KC89_9BACT|nr:MAG: Glycosyl hydrolase family [Candidatus Collierbacteria bacterium GW2011_GWA1_44_12]KKT45419.1 MAG: Glycosyl hydrolase family [Candidatus Collierbacteria bacterium GW2011_GWF2_44_15]
MGEYDSVMGKEVVVGLHYYQPPRFAAHPLIEGISTDPEGKDWTRIITKECYRPLAEVGVMEKASFDVFQSLLLQLEKIDPPLASLFYKAAKENGIGEPFIHPILPDLSNPDKDIVIRAGVNRFQEITGTHPRFFWPPETAIDTPTLVRLAEAGYEGFICAPQQVYQADGSPSDSTPTIIDLPGGRNIIALPFDQAISSRLAFDPKINADHFANDIFFPRNRGLKENQILLAWTDAETFGHHWKHADKFLDYLLDTSLPHVGLYPIPINQLKLDKRRLPHGKIIERTAWSCPHGDLVRWHGSCSCHREDTSWKKPFYHALGSLNNSVSEILKDSYGENYSDIVSQFFYIANAHPELMDTPELALVAAKVSSLTARTSCATFFSSPEVSGKISLLYAYQTLLYLKQSGLEAASAKISTQLYKDLDQVHYPHSKGTALATLQHMVG